MFKRICCQTLKGVGIASLISAIFAVGFLVDHDLKKQRIDYAGAVQVEVAKSRFEGWLGACYRADLSLQACVMAWAAGGNG